MASPAIASYGSESCQPIYGGGETCISTDKVLIDKKVMNPASSTKGGTEVFVDNLSVNDYKYSADQIVKFQLTVTNTSDKTLSEVSVSDILPSYVSFVKGLGSYDEKSRTVSFKVNNLNPDESRKYTIEVKTTSNNSLPSGQGVVCVVNQAMARVSNVESRDNSQFCIEKTTTTTKGGLPVMDAPKGMTKTPATGPEMLALFGLIPAGLSGMYLRRKASK